MSNITLGHDGGGSSDKRTLATQREPFQLTGLPKKVRTNLYLPQRSTDWILTAVGAT